jgi:hypothetical protein
MLIELTLALYLQRAWIGRVPLIPVVLRLVAETAMQAPALIAGRVGRGSRADVPLGTYANVALSTCSPCRIERGRVRSFLSGLVPNVAGPCAASIL